jgi:hypothetical protein
MTEGVESGLNTTTEGSFNECVRLRLNLFYSFSILTTVGNACSSTLAEVAKGTALDA